MRVAVTGATGFAGGVIAARLAAEGHEVLALGRRAGSLPPSAGTAWRFAAWDVADPAASPPAELREVDAVVHAAARVAPAGPDAPFRATNVGGTARLLDALGPHIRVVLIGTSSVYDPRVARLGARETEAPVADDRYLNAYARTKAAQERLVRDRRPDALVLRPRAIWGPGDRTLLPRLLARVKGGVLPLPAGGRHPMSIAHIDTLTAAVVAGLAHPEVSGPVNVADAATMTPASLVRRLFAALGRDVRIMPVPVVAADLAARLAEAWSFARPGAEPPLTRYAVAAFARPFTLDTTRLREELRVTGDVDVDGEIERVAATMRARARAHGALRS